MSAINIRIDILQTIYHFDLVFKLRCKRCEEDHLSPCAGNMMALFAFFALNLLCFCRAATSQKNYFIFPPDGGPDGGTPGDSNYLFKLGEVAHLEWVVNTTGRLSLTAWQGQRDRKANWHSTLLLDQVSAPVPTEYVWTVTPLTYESNFRLAPIHFLIELEDALGFNSQFVEIQEADKGSGVTRMAGSTPTHTTTTETSTSGSSTSSSTGSSTDTNNTTEKEPLRATPSSASDDKLGLKLGLGIGISMAFIVGGLIGYLMRRRSQIHGAMDAFVTRKRKSNSKPELTDNAHGNSVEDEPTDVKLAILSSLHPAIEQETLLDVLLAYNGSVAEASAILKHFAQSRAEDGQPLAAKKRLISRKGATMHLYDPVDVAEHTPCTIIHNFLPTEEANGLLRELLVESESFEKISFKLFENVVASPHTSGFFVESYDEMQEQKTAYLYNGARLSDVRRLTPHLLTVKPLVQEAVNGEIQTRIRTKYPNGQKLRYQSAKPWVPNAAFVNCYDGPKESVGWHSDQLTYLGPRAVIGSISLGVSREFREEWKHSVSPAPSVEPHPIAGNKRINITYRYYRDTMHPKHTPKCKCGIPCVLRVVQRKKENYGKYFWMCHAGNVPGKESCAFFEWARFDDDGDPCRRAS
ncbi:unnamed protein product [Parascedosporium putredinis]|uniref:GRF-type domain-containing protein n=1 Tax=Parascedosporium putredinis TaxID=1442378 RepID=A0A9P1M5Y1_9PEZI|nr:unnamed protein product [Parascedosporium putredinis]CAI7987790.1 unnamed protein product [Parascedosporium putredinis]